MISGGGGERERERERRRTRATVKNNKNKTETVFQTSMNWPETTRRVRPCRFIPF